MLDLGKNRLLRVDIDAVDYEAATSRLIGAAAERRPLAATALAVHGVVTADRDPGLRARINDMDLVTPDGQPVRWALNALHSLRLPDRVYGPTLTLHVLAECARRKLPVYLYGSTPEVLAALQTRLTGMLPDLQIAGATPSRFATVGPDELRAIASDIEASGARLVLVGLGCPRQETFAHEIRQYLSMPTLAVGAAFDFHAGLLAQAPRWMQARGLEWLFRLIAEPRRLWRRYVLLNPYFLARWALQALRPGWLAAPADRVPVGERVPA